MTHEEARRKAIEAAVAAYEAQGSGYPVDEESMRAAIAAYELAMWNPIETLPQDAHVAIFDTSDSGCWTEHDDIREGLPDATHWRYVDEPWALVR